MGRPIRYSPEMRERVVRMVFEHEPQHDSQWAAAPLLRRSGAHLRRCGLGVTGPAGRGATPWVNHGRAAAPQGPRGGESGTDARTRFCGRRRRFFAQAVLFVIELKTRYLHIAGALSG